MRNEGADVLTHERVPGKTSAQLRVLATTDVHMQLLGHGYVADRAQDHRGLAGIATLVEDARAEAAAEGRATLLLDNGDLLQGTALGGWVASQQVTKSHPVANALNLMRYDAVGLGNHDLDYGLSYLKRMAQHLDMPMISSNLHQQDMSPLRPYALINCPLPGSQGEALRVGILSVLPEQTSIWNRHVLQGSAQVSPAEACVQRAVPQLRALGADLVVVLAHMGIEEPNSSSGTRDCALPLAKIDGVDAIITGHTHRRFPGSDHHDNADVDTLGGTLAQCPASMPGYSASDLAVLDLTLSRGPGEGWKVIGHVSRLVPNNPQTLASPAILAACAPAHNATRAYLATPVATLEAPMHTYFSVAKPTPTAALVARAKAITIRRALVGRPEAALPIVATASAHTSGGREGSEHFLHIPAGPVLRRHVAGLDPYLNDIWALRVTGADLRGLLEHAARIYAPLTPGRSAQKLVDTQVPRFDFDTVFGLEYTIDPTRPRGQRITTLNHDGHPVQHDQPFVLATNQFRAAGGGGYAAAAKHQILPTAPVPLSYALVKALTASDDMKWRQADPWKLRCTTPTTAVLLTSPHARSLLSELAAHRPVPLGIDGQGFLHLQITL